MTPAELLCPRGSCVDCEGADPNGHHWLDCVDDDEAEEPRAMQECKHCEARRPHPDDEDDDTDEYTDETRRGRTL